MHELQKVKLRLALGRFWRAVDGPLSVVLALIASISFGMALTAYYIKGIERTFDTRLAHARTEAIRETDATWSGRYSELSGRLDKSMDLTQQSLKLSQTLSDQIGHIGANQRRNMGIIQRRQTKLAYDAASQAAGETVNRLTVDSRKAINQAVRGKK